MLALIVVAACGVHNVFRRTYAPVSGSTAELRGAWLAEVTALVEFLV